MENKEKNSVSELMETTMTKIREMVDSNSVIGEPITTPVQSKRKNCPAGWMETL